METDDRGMTQKAVEGLLVAVVRLAIKDMCMYSQTHSYHASAIIFFRHNFRDICDYYPGLMKFFDEDWLRAHGDMKFIDAERWINIIKRDLPAMLLNEGHRAWEKSAYERYKKDDTQQ